MASITSITTTGRLGATVTIDGAGFGATQGSSTVIFWPYDGATTSLTPTSWSGTQIEVTIPADGSDSDLGQAAFVAVVIDGDPLPAKSDPFTLLDEVVAAASAYQAGDYVFAPAGAESITPLAI